MRGLISIHDVMPDTLHDIRGIIHFLERHQVGPVTLLVVPGKAWERSDIRWLKDLQEEGYNLAGHGWNHEALKMESFKHRIHSVILSRDSAEHLSLKGDRVIQIIRDSYQWFQEVGLERPFLYVPPAWALGNISRENLGHLPYRLYETLSGLYDSETDSTHRIPLVGFEADDPLRASTLPLLNALNTLTAALSNRPVRIAIHPRDLKLALAPRLSPILERCHTFMTYRQVLGV